MFDTNQHTKRASTQIRLYSKGERSKQTLKTHNIAPTIINTFLTKWAQGLKTNHAYRVCTRSLFLASIKSLHLSAYSHQSKHDWTFPLETITPQVGHCVSSSSLHISTPPPHLGHLRYEGVGLINCDMPGHEAGFLDIKGQPSQDLYEI